jgi:hypothetical protein
MIVGIISLFCGENQHSRLELSMLLESLLRREPQDRTLVHPLRRELRLRVYLSLIIQSVAVDKHTAAFEFRAIARKSSSCIASALIVSTRHVCLKPSCRLRMVGGNWT